MIHNSCLVLLLLLLSNFDDVSSFHKHAVLRCLHYPSTAPAQEFKGTVNGFGGRSVTSLVRSHRELTLASDAPAKSTVPLFPCGDALDVKIFDLAFPAILNLAVIPLVGAVDIFYIGKMNNALAIAGIAAANQVFTSTFWILSFLPLVITPLVAAASAAGDKDAVQERIGEALLIGTAIGCIGMVLLGLAPSGMLSLVLPAGAASRVYAEPYLRYRALTFIPAILSTVGFASFRGKMDVVTPLKISLFANLVNALLDPIFIFNFNMGVSGAAAATCVSELLSFCIYMHKMIELKMIKVSRALSLPKLSTLRPFLLGGANVLIYFLKIFGNLSHGIACRLLP